MILVRCPHCKADQTTHSSKRFLNYVRKKCVFCNRSFSVGKNIIKKNIESLFQPT